MGRMKDFYYVHRNDRHALFAVLLVMLLGIIGLVVFDKMTAPASSSFSQYSSSLSQSSSSKDRVIQEATYDKPAYVAYEHTVHEVFPFDPNTASAEDFKRLGLKDWQIRGIMKYRSKGGVYREPNDFARVFGMTKKQFETLLPFIRIGEDYQSASKFYSSSLHRSDSSQEAPVYNYPRKMKAGEHIAINSADTTALMKIPGIGSYYAKSIIRYRDRLGGFVSAQQVLEVEGVPSQAVDYISVDATHLHKLEINKLSVTQLRLHPYLTFYQAKEIFDYRRKFGPIKDIEELRLLKEFPPAEIERLKPYLAY